MTRKIAAPRATPADGPRTEVDPRGTHGRTDRSGPETGRHANQVTLTTATDVDAAVTAAARAFPTWAATPPPTRTAVLLRFHDLIEQHTDRLAAIIGAEQGQTFSDARDQVIRGLAVIGFAGEIARMLDGDGSSDDVDWIALRQPLGVVAGISPPDFPDVVPMWMWLFPITLACGNTFVMRPGTKDPRLAAELAALLAEAGLPDGVFVVVHGEITAANALLAHPQVDAIQFVESTPVEDYIHTTAGRTASILRNTSFAPSDQLPIARRT